MINRKRISCRGFTLVELLVVIGIISILAAVSMTAYTAALSSARTAKCTSNLRVIGSAMIQYAADNNGNLPESGGTIYHSGSGLNPTVDPVTGQNSWTEQIESYVGASNGLNVNPIFQCPDWANTANKVTGLALGSVSNPCQYYSYFNGAHAGGSGGSSFSAVNLLRIKNPSAHIIAGDISFGPFQMNDADPDDYGTNDPAFNGNTLTILRHNGRSNVVFADGHIQRAKSYDNTSMTTHYAGIVTTEAYSDYP